MCDVVSAACNARRATSYPMWWCVWSLALVLFVPRVFVEGAVIEVTAGGQVHEPTYQFSDSSGAHLVNLTGSADKVKASGDMETGSGNSVNTMATELSFIGNNVNSLQFWLGPTISTLRWRAGPVTTIAGSDTAAFADGTGSSARFNYARGIDRSPDGTLLFVVDSENHCIRQVVIATGAVTTIAGSSTAGYTDGTGTSARFLYPYGLVVSLDGTLLFVADTSNMRIRQVVIATGVVTTLAGSGTSTHADGTGLAASFKNPQDLAISPDGTLLFVADTINHCIRQIVIATTVVTTVAGPTDSSEGFHDAVGNAARFNRPRGLAINPDGTLLFVADEYNHRIRQIIIATGVVTTLAGSGSYAFADGMGNAASFGNPCGVAVSTDGNVVIVADTGNNRLRQIVVATGAVTTLAGTGANAHEDSTRGHSASFDYPYRVVVSLDGTTVFVGDEHRIRQVVQAQAA